MNVTTLEEAYEFVLSVGLCTLFSDQASGSPSLWGVVNLPDHSGRTKWGQRLEAVWEWKNALPAHYPDDIFYGKIQGGLAALLSMSHLRESYYPTRHVPVAQCPELAQKVYDIIRLNPAETAEVREEAMGLHHCSKSRFDTALKQLQITLNIARSNEPDAKRDLWLPFTELYPDFE